MKDYLKDYVQSVGDVVVTFSTNWFHLRYPFKEFLKGLFSVVNFILMILSPFLIPLAPIFAFFVVNDAKNRRLNIARREAARIANTKRLNEQTETANGSGEPV